MYNFTYGMTREHCWAGALANRFIDGSMDCKADYNSVTRNITNMKLNARRFLNDIEPSAPFLLYVGFGDVHRCTYSGTIGEFCEHYGAPGWPDLIPDWVPQAYLPSEVVVPPFLPDTDAVRSDLVGQYVAWGRLDQGVGLLLKEVRWRRGAHTECLESDGRYPHSAR